MFPQRLQHISPLEVKYCMIPTEQKDERKEEEKKKRRKEKIAEWGGFVVYSYFCIQDSPTVESFGCQNLMLLSELNIHTRISTTKKTQ